MEFRTPGTDLLLLLRAAAAGNIKDIKGLSAVCTAAPLAVYCCSQDPKLIEMGCILSCTGGGGDGDGFKGRKLYIYTVYILLKRY